MNKQLTDMLTLHVLAQLHMHSFMCDLSQENQGKVTTALLPHQVKTQYVQILKTSDTSIECVKSPISGTPTVKGFMHIYMFYMVDTA